MILGNFRFHLSARNFSLNLCNAANWCKELTIFQWCWYPLLWKFSIQSICTQLCSHTACSLLIRLQEALRKQSFFYVIFNSQNNIASMRRYPELKSSQNDKFLSKHWSRQVSANFSRPLLNTVLIRFPVSKWILPVRCCKTYFNTILDVLRCIVMYSSQDVCGLLHVHTSYAINLLFYSRYA